ncbi:Glycosyltransferase involved in cell wall bisynthesis [Bacteroides luti]|jgi:glycosyltransferase involved in cell wall biosynthesis|uniref:Glycosyltransferase involved in cell wall bisynthesis n=1 Tax=Bacteroides luti TaxID=1297750 RepID=A0A1M4W8G1_9BACE|nr:glycosyltransferase [Bacteroides luti]SHE77460.1 Glycosyltransferase involved in cell wall bisynthesis [Bacteroides luti]
MKNKIIFLECTRHYSYRFSAFNTKTELLAKGLQLQGDDIFIIDSIIGEIELTKPFSDIRNGLRFQLFPRKGFLFWCMAKNFIRLAKLMKKEYTPEAKNIIVLTCPFYLLFLLYILLARIYRYKVVSIIDECHTALEITGSFANMVKISHYLNDRTFGYFVDGILPISHFLMDKISHFHKPFFLLPILADYDFVPNIQQPQSDYFLYCGVCGYYRVISTIIKSFAHFVQKGGRQNLILILSGDKRLIENDINACNLSERVTIMQNVTYLELLQLYSNSLALLIPLSPSSLQDKARFSQKIAEYLSSSRPIITVNVGEIPYYFEDKRNAFVLNELTDNSLCEAMLFVAAHLSLADEVGANGYKTGKESFNYLTVCEKLHNYLSII